MRISDWSSDVCSSDLTNGEQGRDEVKTIRKMMLGAAASALLLTSVTAPAALAQSSANQTALVDYVNPLMGTDSSYRLSYGNTYPAVAVPFGMNSWTPVTGEPGSGWGYTYDGEKISGKIGRAHG